MVVKMEDNQKQLLKCITDNTQKMEGEMDQWSKATKRRITEELNKVETTVVSEVCFLVQQLQAEVQHDLKATFQSLKNSQEQSNKEFHQYKNQMDDFCINTQKFQSDLSDQLHTQMKEIKEMSTHQQKVSSTSIHVSPSSVPIAKSDHLRLTFPTFGKPTDDPDPLNYLTQCHDFLALHPLSDVDLLASFRTVLYGTVRDWWDVARTSVFTWTEFEAAFLSAFLSED